MQHPSSGGSFIRQKDGSLKRADEIAPSTEAELQSVTTTAAKPPRVPRSTTKDK